jgi:hypothetical protein
MVSAGPWRGTGSARRFPAARRAGLCRWSEPRPRTRAPRHGFGTVALYPAPIGYRVGGRARRAGPSRPGRVREIRPRGLLADLLEGMAGAPPRRLATIPRRRGAGSRLRRGDGPRPRRRGADGNRVFRCLGPGTCRDRLSAQSRAHVVRQYLDPYPAPSLEPRGGVFPEASVGRRPRVQYVVVALGRRPADRRQGLSRSRGQHREVHRRSVRANPRSRHQAGGTPRRGPDR